MTLPGTAAIPAVHADRLRAAEATGARAVALARSDLTPDKIITAAAVENAARVLLALGGSTNGVIHLAAIAGRARREVRPQAPQRALRHHARAGGGEAGGHRVLHGGLLRRRRHRRRAARVEAAAQSRLHDRDRRDAAAAAGGRGRRLRRPPRHQVGRPSRWSRMAAWSRCSARWRPMARSSSARPRRRRCSRRPAARWCSPRSRTSPPASTIPSST